MAELPDGTRVGRVALAVEDLDGVGDFHEATVGLHPIEHGDGGATLGAGCTELLELAATPERAARPGDAAGLFHVAFRVPDRAALADGLARLREGDRMTGASDHLVSEALYARDPEGNGVELYRDRPRSAWDRPAPGEVRIDTLPLDLADLAPEAAGAPGVPAGTDVGHVHLEVTDLDRARAFYVDALGFDVTAHVRGALFVAAGGYHHHLGLNVWNGRTAPAAGRGLEWFELLVPDAAALSAARERLADAGYDVTATDEGATVEDPDGIEVRLAVDG